MNFRFMVVLNAISDLIKKYDIPVPRYTSYPTVPLWDSQLFTSDQWPNKAKETFDMSNGSKGISLYIHLRLKKAL